MPKAQKHSRNKSLFDKWSVIHIVSSAALAWMVDPLVAIVLLVLWEPLEIFVLSPILAKFGIVFGFETLQNSLTDIVYDVIGVIIGAYLLRLIITPPVILF